MKLSVENLGPIKQGDFELNDLTILVGPNNSGKTYLVTALCAVLDGEWIRKIDNSKFEDLAKKITSQNHEISISEFNKGIQDIIDLGLTTHLQINSYFGSQRLNICKIKVTENKNSYQLKFHGIFENGDIYTFSKDKAYYIFQTASEFDDLINRIYFAIRSHFIKFHTIVTSERQGISLFYKELYQSRFNLVESLQKNGDLDELSARSSKLSQITSNNLSTYLKLDDQPFIKPNDYIINILKSIIGGEIEKYPYEDIRYYTDDLELSMHEVSSSIRSFVDIYLFLTRKKRQPNELLIIDEPESHLTLDNQRVLARLLVAMVNDGIKVLISTHSDFLVKEVNNLILLHGIKNKEGFLRDFPDYTEQDFIDPARVSLFEFGDGTIKNAPVGPTGISSAFIDKALINLYKTTSALDNYYEAERRAVEADDEEEGEIVLENQ